VERQISLCSCTLTTQITFHQIYEGFSPHTKQTIPQANTSWAFLNSVLTLLEDGVWFHRLRVQAPRVSPTLHFSCQSLTPGGFICASDWPAKYRDPTDLSSDLLNLLEWLRQHKETCLVAKDTNKEMHRTKHVGRGIGIPCPPWAYHSQQPVHC
jgi:hypothetical protein